MRHTNTALPQDIARTFPVLVVGEVLADRAEARSAHAIEERLLEKDLHVLRASSLFDAETAVASDAGFSCVVLSWKLCAQDLAQGLRVIELIRRRTSGMPILLAMTREDRSRVPLAYVECMDEAFTQLPDAELSPHATYSQLVRRNVEKIPVSALPDCIVAVQLVPYPPGIPIMMPGERVTAKKCAVVDYLLALQHFDSRFPGFGHDTHGIEVERDRDGKAIYMTRCLKA